MGEGVCLIEGFSTRGSIGRWGYGVWIGAGIGLEIGWDGILYGVWLGIPFWNWGYVVSYRIDCTAATFNVYFK